MTLPDRFWSKVAITPCCWLWTRGVSDTGYGSYRIGGRGTPVVNAHKLAYEDLVGPVPPSLTLDHLCRVHRCVNPDHLEPVTRGVNVQRGSAFKTISLTCLAGHLYTWENTYVRPDGARICRECRNRAVQRCKERQRAGVSRVQGREVRQLRQHSLV